MRQLEIFQLNKLCSDNFYHFSEWKKQFHWKILAVFRKIQYFLKYLSFLRENRYWLETFDILILVFLFNGEKGLYEMPLSLKRCLQIVFFCSSILKTQSQKYLSNHFINRENLQAVSSSPQQHSKQTKESWCTHFVWSALIYQLKYWTSSGWFISRGLSDSV